MRAIVTADIVRGAIDASHACGGPLGPRAWQESNINDLTDLDNCDPISGFPVYKSLLCEVAKLNGDDSRLVIGSGQMTKAEMSLVRKPRARLNIYLDHNATTPMASEVKEYMQELSDAFGNPSSIHSEGRRSARVVDEARRRVASEIGCTARRIVFTGGGTESNNMAIKGMAFTSWGGKDHIVTSSVEHPAVLETCRWLEQHDFEVTYLDVDGTGRVNPDALREAITERTCLVSVIMASNETGTIQPIAELAGIAGERGVTFHTDAVQAVGKVPVNVEELGVDLLTLSSHKVHGPKGVGALYVRKGVVLESLIHGGGQEGGLRSGTANTLGIGGFGRAMELVPALLARMEGVRGLRDRLEAGIRGILESSRLNGHRDFRLPNTVNITLPGFRGESVVLEMDKRGVYFSSGSACHSGSPEPSHALLAMGLTEEDAHCALRFSLGHENTQEEIDRTLELLGEVISRSKHIVRFVSCK
jgi:cysteine desulfurase NifS